MRHHQFEVHQHNHTTNSMFLNPIVCIIPFLLALTANGKLHMNYWFYFSPVFCKNCLEISKQHFVFGSNIWPWTNLFRHNFPCVHLYSLKKTAIFSIKIWISSILRKIRKCLCVFFFLWWLKLYILIFVLFINEISHYSDYSGTVFRMI